MKHINVAVLQLLPAQSVGQNLEISLAACRKAKQMGADIALFPEMWNTGYVIPETQEELQAAAVTEGYLRVFQALAAELEMAICITYLEPYASGPRNALAVFDRHGTCILSYAKVHTCDFGDERRLTPGEDFYVADLDTAQGPVRIGAMICYDREFPESARILMLKGAELVLVPNACPMEINRLSQLRARAYENMMSIVTCNYPSGKPDCNGHSSAFDGIAYLPDQSGSRDTCLLDAPETEGVYMATIDLDLLRDYRSREVHGNAYRRPEVYHALIETEIQPPFLRDDRR